MNAIESFRRENSKQLKLSESRLRALVAASKDPVLRESRFFEDHNRALVKEAILFERLTLIEAANADPHHTAEMMDGMITIAGMLANRLGDQELAGKLDSIRIPDVFELDSMHLSKPHLKKFMKDFADVATLTKGLLALSDDLGDQQGGMGGGAQEVIKTLQSAGGFEKDGTLGNALFAYDNASDPGHNRKKLGFGRGKQVNMEKKLKDSIARTLKTKAPGALKLINVDSLVNSMKAIPMERIVRAFRAYPAGVQHYVDDDMLMSLSKGPGGVMGILKGLVDLFQGGGTAPSRG